MSRRKEKNDKLYRLSNADIFWPEARDGGKITKFMLKVNPNTEFLVYIMYL